MNPNRKRFLMSFIHGITILSMIVTMTVPMAALTTTVNAQDATQDVSAPTETPTESPAVSTEAPTDTPAPATDTPPPTAEGSTPEATAVITDESTSTATEEATAAPTDAIDVTEEVTVTPSETPVSTLLFQDDFQDGETTGWALTPGWTLVSEADNTFLSAGTPNETAAITAVTPADFAFAARVRIAAGNKASLAFRSGAESYSVLLDMGANTATLLKNADIVGTIALIPPAADENGEIPLVWHSVTINAAGSSISATVDGLPVGAAFVDPNPLPAGAIVLITDAANTGSVAIDDVVINTVEPVSVTVTPTEAATEEITPEITPTLEPTDESTPETTPEAAGQVILSADFEGELQGWSVLTEGASIVTDSNSNHALLLAPSANFLPGEPIYLADFNLDMRLNITTDAQDGTASGISIPFHTQEGKSYVLSVEAGQSVLYRNDGEGLSPLASSPTAHTLNTWHTLNLNVSGGHLVVTIDSVPEIDVTETEPLVSGQIAFVANSASSIMIDDVVVTDFSGVLAMNPTAEPMGLSEEAVAKLPPSLADVVIIFVSGDTAGAQQLAQDNYLPMDEQGLIQVVVWATEGETGESLSTIVQTLGGVADYVTETSVGAHLPLSGFAALINTPQISAIKLASLATSTGLSGAPAGGVTAVIPPAGTIISEGFDVVSANNWLAADVAGTGQGIAVIDESFAGASATCAGEGGTTASHGAQVMQILCDVAPKATYTLYTATTANTLTSAINNARAAVGISTILITLDMGVDQSAGDGTGSGNAATDFYAAINTAVSAGKLVIVSAGNNNSWASDTSCKRFDPITPTTCILAGDPFPDGHLIGRYFTFNYTSGAAPISIPVKVKSGDTIRVSWNDWDGLLNGSNAEDFDIVLSNGITQTIHNATATVRAAAPGEAYDITPANCGSGLCSADLLIGGTTGTGSFGNAGTVVFQVQISGEGLMDSNGITGLRSDTGNLARPADATGVIAVGAVCARPGLNYPILQESSVGPIFAANGTGAGANGTTPLTLKPTVVGPADVSIAGNIVTDPSTNGCRDGNSNGFSGTSAAAAYIAAEAALIRSNSNANVNPSTPTAMSVTKYLLSHTVDLYTGTEADGFDQTFGAGISVLGNPVPTSPVIFAGTIIQPVPEPLDPACASFVYVSNANPAGATFGAQGTIANPYVHPAEALAEAAANACVILMPGEFVSGIYATSPGVNDGIRFRSYDSANAGPDSPTAFWTNNDVHFGDGAGIVIEGADNLSVEGFTLQAADPFNPYLDPVAKTVYSVSFPRPFSLMLRFSNGNKIIGNTINGFRGGHNDKGTKTQLLTAMHIYSVQNVSIQSNLFTNNDGDGGAALRIEASNPGPVTIQRNFFQGNTFTGVSIATFNPTIKVFASRTNIYNNRFTANNTKSLILVDDGSSTSNTSDFSGPELQVFGNSFTNNTNSGPVVHLYPGRNFRFVNNTVAGNKSILPGNESTIILVGEGGGSPTSGNAQLDIHNNVFYGNNSGSLVKDLGFASTCDSNDGGTKNGARNNWSFASGSGSGPCQESFPLFGNSINVHDPGDPTIDAGTSEFVGTAISPDDPYQLKAIAFGIDASNESLITAFNASLIAIPAGVDALGKTRKNGTVDLGAYEFKPVTAGPTGTITRAEDLVETSSPLNLGTITPTPTKPVIMIPLYASGGFGSYSFEIVTTPQNYSTDPTNACGGQTIFYDPSFFDATRSLGRALYCPPRHFYNQGIADTAAEVTFEYRVRDGAGNFSNTDTVTIVLTPTVDRALGQTPPAVLPPYSTIGVLTEPPTAVSVRLRPYARFGNFRLAAAGDTSLLPSADNTNPNSVQAQYPYTYSGIGFPDHNGGNVPGTNCGNDYNPTLFGANEGASETYLSGRFGAMSGGIMTVTPLTGQVGCFPISYTATDAGSSSKPGHIARIIVVGSLPDKGLHDDTSFSFDYHGQTNADVGGWTPIYSEGNINNTLHQSVTLNDTAEFLFDGVGFALYMQGSTLGGSYEVQLENAGVPVTLNWTAVTGVTGQLQSTAGGLNCRTTATLVAGQTAPFKLLSNVTTQPYVVSCNGFLDGEANKVIVINKAAKQLNIDAIGILTDTDPLQFGVHEVTEAQLLPTFFGWTPVTDTLAVGQKAVYTTSTNSDFNFRFQGTGFALGTALQKTSLAVQAGQPLGVQYKVCVADTADPTDKICQSFDNGVGATTALAYKTYRPFFGFDPANTYDVSVNITNIPNYSGTGVTAVKMKFYMDSIVVFNQLATAVLSNGITEDDNLGPIVFGNGLDDTWSFNTNNTLASNKSLTSIVATVPKVGPFISFQIPTGADTLNWFQVSPTLNTTQALICVDRNKFGLKPVEAGNCILMNTRTGAYFQISASGALTNDTTPETTSANPLIISEGMFRSAWPSGTHTVEISSLSNETFNLDKIQVIDSDGPLTAGYYEENVRNLRYFTEGNGGGTTDSIVLAAAGNLANFSEVTLASASGGKYRLLKADNTTDTGVDTNNLNEGMFFQFTGTGFSVFFNLDTKADAVRICWKNDNSAPSNALVTSVLTTGTCQTYDNQSSVVRYKAARTIAGLPNATYSVAVQMLADQGEPAVHTAATLPISMAVDAVQVYSNPLPVNVLNSPGTRYETSFTNQAADGRFLYLGTGWKSVTGTAANLYSGQNYDSIVNVIGAGVVFQTNGAANAVIYRDTRVGFAPIEACVTKQSSGQRRCTIIKNDGGTGYQQPIVVPLFDTTQHTVSVVTTDFGTFNLDAVGVSNTPLQPGVYDENNPALIYSYTSNALNNPLHPVYSDWKDIASTTYQDGGAMQSQLPANATDHASVSFTFTGTGFSLLTLFDSFSGVLDVDIDGTTNDFMDIPVNSYNAAAIYKSAHSITGLPKDTYVVTITENDVTAPTKRRRFTVDGVEIYGTSDPTGYDPAKQMNPGFYDDNATNANGDLYLSYGPSNAAWTLKAGTLAPTYMNQTNHYTTRYGAELTFEVLNANAITLFHNASTTSSVRVCAVNIGTAARTCDTQSLAGKSNTTFTAPFAGGVDDYYVSITNLTHNLPFYVDAIGVYSTTLLSEGIYQENNPGLTFTGTWPSAAETVATDKVAKSTKTVNNNLKFTFSGTGFSIVLAESTATSGSYRICVDSGTTIGGCAVINANPVPLSNTTATKRAVALTYVGLTSGTYTVQLTNLDTTGTRALVVDRVDILGALTAAKQIGAGVTGNIENTDPRITFFPFFVQGITASASASGGNQSTLAMQGSVAYFEITNTAGTLDFEYVRQTAAANGNVQVCSNAAGQGSAVAASCGANVTSTNPINNTVAPVGYQKSEPVSINGTGLRWVILRNADGKPMPLDFIRPTVAGAPLTAGYYEENHPELSYVDGSGAATTFATVAAPSASGGQVFATTTVNDALLFEFTGTGFSTFFTLDPKADAVKICWRSGSGNLAYSQNTGSGAQCQTYDNQSTPIRYKAARTIVGLPQGSYTASVQMLADNNLPAVHAAAALPITMQIDAVQIYADALPTTVLNTLGTRYETSYVNRVADKMFLYYGTGWLSYSGTAYKLYSGSNFDKITGVVGAGVLFQTNNTDSIILYRQTAAGYSPLEVCATRISDGNRLCTIIQNNGGAGYQQPIGVPLNGSGPQAVSIVTLDGGTFALDAIQLANSTAPLTAGSYDDSYPGLSYTGSGWTTVFSTGYSGGSAHQTTNADPATGDTLTFTFTGTGFEIGTGIDRYGGEMEVCYGVGSYGNCFTYQNESTVVSNLVSRTVTGLASNTYQVRVRHSENGQTVIAPVGPRLPTYTPSRLRIDYVNIFNNTLPPVVTQGGLYNEDAANGGTPYLQLLPANRWGGFSGTTAAAFSNKSYVGVVDATKKLVSTYAGPSATLRVQVPAGGATVILYTGAAIATNTNSLLVCANNVVGTDPMPTVPPIVNCIIVTDLRTSNQVILDSTKLLALGSAGTATLTFRALTPGLFRIDGFQLVQGSVLTAGLYDDFLAGTNGLLKTTGTWVLAPATAAKLATAYGGTQAIASTNGSTMTFDFQGTGFGVFTTVEAVGVDVRICYKLQSNVTPFPAQTVLNQTGKGTTGAAAITCHTHTTDTNTPVTDWAAKNGNNPRPVSGYQFGFDFHGLTPNTYSVEILLIRPAAISLPNFSAALAATDRLKVDAIAVFSDITTGTVLASAPGGQYYDDASAGIRYEPGAFWTNTVATTGPTTGPWNKTVHTTSKPGAIAQFDMNGNGFILYQTAIGTGSKWVRVCVKSVLGEECSEFSQNKAAATYFTPIAFYGLGSFIDHQIIIENRDYGRNLSIDGLKIIP